MDVKSIIEADLALSHLEAAHKILVQIEENNFPIETEQLRLVIEMLEIKLDLRIKNARRGVQA